MVTTQKNDRTGGLLRWLQVPNGRAEVSLDNIVMAAGGILVPLGLARLFASAPLGVFSERLTPGPVPLFLAAFLIMALASVLLFVPQLSTMRPAGLASAATGVALLAESVSRIGDSPKGGFGIFLFAIFSLGLFVFPPTRHTYFLGAVLYSGWRFLVLLTSDLDVPNTFAGAMDPRLNSNFSSITSALSILVAGGCLGAVWFLDRSDSQGLSTPFAAVGITAATVAVTTGPNFFVSFLVFILAGAAAWVGVFLSRRGIAWAGAAGLVLAAFKLYDGFNSRFAGFVTLVVGIGLLTFAARSLLPGVAKAVNGLASNKAVLPTGAQPGHPNASAQSFPTVGNAPQGFDNLNSAPGFVQPASGQETPNLAPGFVQPANGFGGGAPGFVQSPGGFASSEGQAQFNSQAPEFPQADPSNIPGPPEHFPENVQPTPTFEFQPSVGSEEPQEGQFMPGSFSGRTNKVEHPTEEIEAATAVLAPQQGDQGGSHSDDAQVMEPNWYADPTERYDHRWHDGVNWTEHVATAGNSAVDPIG